jgi:hypothetical protein
MTAVDLFLRDDPRKEAVWLINAESDYHESK